MCRLRFAGWCSSAALAMGLAGCHAFAPKMPAILASAVPISYPTTQFNDDVKKYRDDLTGGQVGLARILRDQIIFRVMAQIDMAYGKFEGQMTTRRAGVQTAGDAANLGVTAAATVVGASGVKDILDATSIALQGTRLSYDKNFFEQKTTESLVSQMRASRKALKAAILSSLNARDVASYPLEAAWGDLIQYYYAGTIPSALVDIAGKTGDAANAADAKLAKTVSEITLEAKQAISTRTEYEALKRELADPASAAQAKSTLLAILTRAGVAFNQGAGADELLMDLRQAMIASDSDPALFERLTDAVAGSRKP